MKTHKSKKIKNQFRQGDILIERIDVSNIAGKDISENGRIILAHGEVTGHCHAIEDARDAAIVRPEGPIAAPGDIDSHTSTQSIVKLGRGAKLVHDEHATIALPAGTYRVTRQREYSPEAIRNVAD